MEPNPSAPSEASDVHMREQVRGVKELHDSVDRMRVDLKRASKLAKAYATASEPLNDLGLELAEQLQEFGSGKDEIAIYVRQCGEMLKLTEAMRQLLVQQLESGFSEPLRVRLEAEAAKESSMKDLHKQWTSAGEAYTEAHKKWNKAKDPRGSIRPGGKMNKIEADVSDARAVFEKISSDYHARLKEMDHASRMEMAEFVSSYMQANISFFVSGYQLLKAIEPQVNSMTANVQRAKGEPHEVAAVVDIFSLKAANAAAPVKPGTNVTKQGYLFKKKSKGLKAWGIRWFVLDANGVLTWFKSWKKFTQTSEALNIFYSTVRPSDAGNLIFEVISKSRPTLQLKALNVQEFNDWLNTFSKAIQLNISIGNNITPAERAVLLAQQRRMDDEVRLASPANTVCADCNAPQPDWASLNLGILLCIECSGVHRSLGSHISKIRSLTLDLWEPEHVEIMKCIGNAKANGFWEAELPREFLKPEEKTVRRLREVYIDNKYKAKAFLPKHGIPPEVMFQTMKDAACRHDLMTVERCVAYGAEVNAKNLGDSSKTVAHYLAEGGHNVALEFLFQNGADLAIKDAKGNYPIHYAAQRGHQEVFRLLVHRGVSDALLAEPNSDGHTVTDLAVLHPALAECLDKRREKIKAQQMQNQQQQSPVVPTIKSVSTTEASKQELSPSSGSKLKRAASSYSPRSGNTLLSSSPPDKKSLSTDFVAAAKVDKTPADLKKPPVKPKPAHLSRRKLSDGSLPVSQSSARHSQTYAHMPGINQEAPAPAEGVSFPIPREDSSPRPPSNTSPRLSLRRSPPSAPNVTTAPEKEKDRERDEKKEKERERDKKKKDDKKGKDNRGEDIPISGPSNFRHVTHYESADAPALIQQAESKRDLKKAGPESVAIGGPSGFKHVSSWQDQFEKKPGAVPAAASSTSLREPDDVSSVSERRDTLQQRALYPYPSMSVEVYEENADSTEPSRRTTMTNGERVESPPATPSMPVSPTQLERSKSSYPPPPPGDSEFSPRNSSADL